MATSGSLTTSSYDGRYYKLAWERTSYSTANNTSTIKWTLSAHGGDVSYYAERTLEVVIAGKTVKSKTSSVNRYTGEIDSGTLTISHNTDGTKSFTASVRAAVYYSSVNCTGSKTFTLTAIPRESTISATSAYVENQSTITVSRKVSSYTHTITWSCGSASGTVCTKSSSTSIKWTLPTSLYSEIGSTATSKTVTLTCKTYNSSGTQIGSSKTCTLTAKTSESRNGPSISPTITPDQVTRVLCGNSTTVIKGLSDITIAFGASAQDSATLSSKKVTNGSKSRTTDGLIADSTDGKFVFTATDSRGYSTSVTKTLSVINYVMPTCAVKVYIDANGTASVKVSGSFYNSSFGAKNNNIGIKLQFKKSSDTNYSSTFTYNLTDISKSGNTYEAEYSISGLSTETTYVFRAEVNDSVPIVTTSNEYKVKSQPVFDWGETDFNFNVPISAPNLGRTVYNCKDYIDTSVTGKVTADGISGYFYLLKPFNLVFCRFTITDFTSATAAGSDAITAIKFKTEFLPASNCALTTYGASDTDALMNSDGSLRLRTHGGLSTASDLYISGLYPLSSNSSLFI